jgi:mono/diheme cytochrome c family protein
MLNESWVLGIRQRRRIPLASLLGTAAFALITLSTAQAARADDGAAIFASKCSACHTIGKGKTVGPDLKGITTKESHDWLVKWVSSPSTVIKSGDPTATQLVKQYPVQMPDLGLSTADVDAVLGYIAQQSGGGGATATAGKTAAAPAMPAGDAAVGRELFVGGAKLHNGGPPCMSCHSISGIGALGGGTLGPDLTNAYTKYGGDAGLASFLSGVPTPTMSAVWSKTPLQPQEIANLVAFVKEGAVAQRPLSAIGQLAILAVIGLVIIVLIGAIYWRNRLMGVRIPLVQDANASFPSRIARRM